MALYVQVYLNGRQETKYVWHVGKDNPVPFIDRKYVESVQADCDELEYIKRTFTNLPHAPLKRVVSWYGDHAKFIAANLT